jgi:hypothetical protein
MLNIHSLPKNYSEVVKAATRLAVDRNWHLEDSGEFTLEATLAYIEHMQNKARSGKVKVATIKSYLSAIEYGHLHNGIKWKARTHHKVRFAIRQLKKDKKIPQQIPTQDYEFKFCDLEELCSRLDSSKREDVIVGALATCLFWALGRVPELLHAEEHDRLKIGAFHKSPIGLWQILLERPKVIKDTVQILTPVESDKQTRANTWITILLFDIPKGYSSPWQLSKRSHASSKWFFGEIQRHLGRSIRGLGPSSFRAGGLTYLASRGLSLDHLQLLGRWDSSAWKRYLRNHPWVLSEILRNSRGPSQMLRI